VGGVSAALALTAALACSDSGGAGPNGERYPGVAAALNLNLDAPRNYTSPAWPAYYDADARTLDNTPFANLGTDRGATLGRVLFHDVNLSINRTVSCARCHAAGTGFVDTARFSVGFDGRSRTTAHSMRLGNARFYRLGSAFWDRRALSLEEQATDAIQSPVEMGFDQAHGGMDALIARMRGLAYYPELFTWAFGDSVVSEVRIGRAIAQYVRSIVSLDSRFDRAFALVYDPALPDKGVTRPFPGFTAEENRGKELYFTETFQGGAGCGRCHRQPTFTLFAQSASNGLDAGETRIFKSPSLKNVALIGPYMHDGRFATLRQVIEHYVSGVQPGPALDGQLRIGGGQGQRLSLSEADKSALVAFLTTLNDSTVIADPKFSDPFRR
jgi:cytochrome c peroxidase